MSFESFEAMEGGEEEEGGEALYWMKGAMCASSWGEDRLANYCLDREILHIVSDDR